MIDRVASDEVIAAAFEWLCQHRKYYPPRADVWALRHDWARQRDRIQDELRAGTYRLSSVQRTTNGEGEILHVLRAADALVLKALAIVLQEVLDISDRCRGRVDCLQEGLLQGQLVVWQRPDPAVPDAVDSSWRNKCRARVR